MARFVPKNKTNVTTDSKWKNQATALATTLEWHKKLSLFMFFSEERVMVVEEFLAFVEWNGNNFVEKFYLYPKKCVGPGYYGY